MVLDEIEIPRFSELKPVVVDSAVRKNPAKWRERNKRRAASRRAAARAAEAASPPSWEVPQPVAQPEADGADKDIKEKLTDEVPNSKAPGPPDVPAVPAPQEEEEMPGRPRKEGRTMPGGYYVRSPDEAHKQTMRAFNVRLSKPYQRPPPRPEEEELPPLEPEEELDKGTSSLPSRAARLAAQRLRQSQELSQEQQKKRQEEEVERRKEAERRVERRLLEEKIRKLREEQDAKEQARREGEAKRLEEAQKQAARQAEQAARRCLAQRREEEAEKLRLRRQKDAEEDAMLREERRRRRQQEETARLQREKLRRQEEEQRRQEREREQQKRREEKEAKRLEEERAREAEREAEVQRLAEELRRRVELEAKVETEEELRRREEVEKEQRRKRAEQRRREIREKADRAKKAAALGLPPAAAAAAAAQQLAQQAAPAEVQVTVAVLGHQGSGKSTLVGALMLATGTINERDLLKRRKDLERFPCDELQREDGLRSGNAELTLLDVPGGRRCLPQAVQAAAEADVALLVVSAKGRELEAALREASGTSALAEQLRVAKGLGANRLLVAVTKMEEASWAQDRFNDVASALAPVLTNAGFKQASTVFVPVDGFTNQLDARKAAWHSAGSLLKCLDETIQNCQDARRSGALEVLLFESFSAAKGGLRVRGRVEQGLLQPGQRCLLAPGGRVVHVEVVQTATRQPLALQEAKSGQNVELQLSGNLPDWPSTAGATAHAWRGAVLHSEANDCQVSEYLKAQLEVIEMPRPLTAGFKAVLHVHAATVEAEIEKILDAFDWSTGITTEKPKVVKAGQRLTVMLRLSREVPLSSGSRGSRLGMLMLRLEETTVAIGHVLEAK